MIVTAATLSDADAVIGLWNDCGLTRPWNDPVADFHRAIAAPCSTVLIAQSDGAIIGTLMVGHDGHRGWVYYLAVAKPARGRGYGRALMAAAEAWLAERAVPKLQLMVRDTNDEARAFYSALGYTQQPVSTWGKGLDTADLFL